MRIAEKRMERCTLWSTLTFQRRSSFHITLVIDALMCSKTTDAQRYGPTMTLGHSCTNVATRMLEAQGCPCLMAREGER
jgi:hypothetical protein